MTTYTVWSLDVWGNEEDGFEVNDRCKVGTIELFEGLSDEGILDMLDADGYIHASLCEIEDGGWQDFHIVAKANGRPLLTLEGVVDA